MENNLDIIMKQTNCNYKTAKQMYKKHNNDTTDAILDILGKYNETKIKEKTYDDVHRNNILKLRDIENSRIIKDFKF